MARPKMFGFTNFVLNLILGRDSWWIGDNLKADIQGNHKFKDHLELGFGLCLISVGLKKAGSDIVSFSNWEIDGIEYDFTINKSNPDG